MEPKPEISVIIPTYNRKWFLEETLDSLARQTFPGSKIDVIVVDDGSTESVQDIIEKNYPFKVNYVYQNNQGDAEARNTGARKSQADLLVFLDDDILVGKEYLELIVAGHQEKPNRIIVGSELIWLSDDNPLEISEPNLTLPEADRELVPIDFTKVCSNNMSVRREAYLSIGPMQNLDFPGSSIWCDVDFSYRAQQKGFEFFRNSRAVCWHRDYVVKNLRNQNRRWKEAAYRAVSLFQKYPDLIQHLPMFSDKTPVNWNDDPVIVIVRKVVRRIASSKPAMWILEKVESILSGGGPGTALIPHLHRWIVGGYIYQGYREGIQLSLRSKLQ